MLAHGFVQKNALDDPRDAHMVAPPDPPGAITETHDPRPFVPSITPIPVLGGGGDRGLPFPEFGSNAAVSAWNNVIGVLNTVSPTSTIAGPLHQNALGINEWTGLDGLESFIGSNGAGNVDGSGFDRARSPTALSHQSMATRKSTDLFDQATSGYNDAHTTQVRCAHTL